jgi:hypothetical protein
MALLAALAVVLVEDGWRAAPVAAAAGGDLHPRAGEPAVAPAHLLQTERSYVGGVVVSRYGD